MPLIRPEISATLRRWSEVLSGIAVALFGLWALQAQDRFFQALAGAILLAGLGIALIGWRRLRFRREGAGPGIVQVVEGQISYFGPETGGFVPVRDLVELHLIARGTVWLLITQDGTRLEIPVTATGADQLFDAFTTLPGLRMADLLAALDAPDPPKARALWGHPAHRGRHMSLR